jgi:hypothetical protein
MTEEPESQTDTPELSPTEEQVLAESNGAPPDLLWISEGVDIVISTIYVYQSPTTGRLRTVLWEPSSDLRDLNMREFPIETKWSVPSKTQLDKYREQSSRFNQAARAVLVHKARMEELIVRNHLLEMKMGSGDSAHVIDLQRDRKGVLTTEAMEHINKLHPTVMDMMLSKFIDEAALII